MDKIPWIFLFVPCLLFGDPDSIGNFSLKTAQQPGPLVSFGQNIIDKGDIQIYGFADAFIGKDAYATDVIPSLLYGVTDSFSLFFNVPFSTGNKVDKNHSSGLEDIFLQPEYAFYTKNTAHSTDQATLVANITFPSGSLHKNPPTGFGAPSFFIGSTYNHMEEEWFIFFQGGAVIPTEHNKTRFGVEYLYQCGYERVIWTRPGMIFAWMVEVDGTCAERNKIDGIQDPNSGGNVIYVNPSLWFSTKRFIIQGGPGFPVVQNYKGTQPTQYVAFFLNIGVTF